MSAVRPHDDTQPIPIVRGRHAAPRSKRSPAQWSLLIAREVGIVAAAVAVIVVIARLLLGQVAYVSDDAMAPTLAPGERVLVTSLGSPSPGDVVLVRSPAAWGVDADEAIVRVIAVGGQQITCCDDDGRITVDGTALSEPYLVGQTDQIEFDAVVPEGRVFVLVDDRDAARDSRALLDVAEGTLALDDVRGRVIAALWPPRSVGG